MAEPQRIRRQLSLYIGKFQKEWDECVSDEVEARVDAAVGAAVGNFEQIAARMNDLQAHSGWDFSFEFLMWSARNITEEQMSELESRAQHYENFLDLLRDSGINLKSAPGMTIN